MSKSDMSRLRSARLVIGLVLLTMVAGPRRGGAFQGSQSGATAVGPEQLAAQEDRQKREAVRQADHQRLMDLLHITSIRPVVNVGDPNAPNGTNYDESKANPYPNLPDPLTLNNGKKVATAKVWWRQRRPEIVEMFDREVYGRVPKSAAQGEVGSDRHHQRNRTAMWRSSRNNWWATWTTPRTRKSRWTSN